MNGDCLTLAKGFCLKLVIDIGLSAWGFNEVYLCVMKNEVPVELLFNLSQEPFPALINYLLLEFQAEAETPWESFIVFRWIILEGRETLLLLLLLSYCFETSFSFTSETVLLLLLLLLLLSLLLFLFYSSSFKEGEEIMKLSEIRFLFFIWKLVYWCSGAGGMSSDDLISGVFWLSTILLPWSFSTFFSGFLL